MSHPLPADLGLDDFHPAFLADDASMFHPLVFTAIALIIFRRAEDLRAEKPVLLRFERPVVNGLRLFHLSVGPRFNLFWGGDGNPDRIIVNGTLPLLIE